MKHLSQIEREFLKQARKWDELSQREQYKYLRKHPKSKRYLTAKPKELDERKYHKTSDGAKIMFTESKLRSGSVFTIDWNELKDMIAKKGNLNVEGFVINENGIDVFHDKGLSAQEGEEVTKKLGL